VSVELGEAVFVVTLLLTLGVVAVIYWLLQED